MSNTPKNKSGLVRYIPESVAQHYYKHGLFCASQPLPVLLFAILGIVWACFPLLTIQVYSGCAKVWTEEGGGGSGGMPPTGSEKPRWLDKPAIGYVQQIVMKAAVHPYTDQMQLTDAFRGPLASSFKLHLADVLGFYDRDTGLDMDHECLRTDGLSPRYRASLSHILPDYGCLILSPANMWRKDPVVFQEEGNLVSTVFNFQSSREGHSSLADIMFGLKQRDTGLTKYPVRNRQRTITYSVTVVLRQHKPSFVAALRRHLEHAYPLHVEHNSQNLSRITHIHFPEQISGVEYVPYSVLVFGLFLYMLFSCRKIELIQSKVGISLTAVVTILGSLFMALGLTGQTLGGSGYVYLVPYAVAFISLENVLVITRSIVSTPAHLDIKIRVAQGLSKEGWNIVKTLFSQITLLTLGFFLGVVDSSIQEFCLFAVMGLLSDFYLQHFFFITVLSMDISRTGFVDILQQAGKLQQSQHRFQHPVSGPGVRIEQEGGSPTGLFAPSLEMPPPKVPRRVQVVNFWAQRRVVSRIFIATMVGWILLFIYRAGLVEMVVRNSGWLPNKDEVAPSLDMSSLNTTRAGMLQSALHGKSRAENITSILAAQPALKKADMLTRLQHRNKEHWRRLPYSHWPMLFGLYNMSVYGSYLTLLPPICLSMVISPEAAIQLRSPNEASPSAPHPLWTLETLKSTLELGDEDDDTDDASDNGGEDGTMELYPWVPTSPGELMLAFTLSIPSILFLLYLCVVCYRFVCTKNYAEWRSGRGQNMADGYTQIVQEGVPVPLQGHAHEIETVLTDGHLVASHCLGGRICVWDSLTGECVSKIDRKAEPQSEADYPKSDVGNQTEAADTAGAAITSMFQLYRPARLAVASLRARRSEGGHQSVSFRRFTERFQQRQRLSSHTEARRGQVGPVAAGIWSMDFTEGLIVLGCQSGRVEVWEACSGELCCYHEDPRRGPVSHIKLVRSRLLVGRLNGHIDFLDLVASPSSSTLEYYGMGRLRTSSSNSLDTDSICSLGENLSLAWRHTVKAHVQAITCLAVQGSRLITGSQDHTLRVFRVEDGLGVYTLHGHCGPITAVFIDRLSQSAAGSASMDGILCMWDLLSGACMYSIQAHDGPVLALVYSPSYVVSSGADGKLCIWERFQGHLINTINMQPVSEANSADLVMLTHNLIVTGRPGCLLVWDVRLPDPVKIVRLGKEDPPAPLRAIRQIGDTIVCSYGGSLRLVRFPIFLEKLD